MLFQSGCGTCDGRYRKAQLTASGAKRPRPRHHREDPHIIEIQQEVLSPSIVSAVSLSELDSTNEWAYEQFISALPPVTTSEQTAVLVSAAASINGTEAG